MYLSLIQWEKLCLGTKEGGLGLRNMASLHKAFMAKLLVRASFSDSSIWARSVRKKYNIIKGNIPTSVPAGASWAWKAIAKAKEVVSSGCQWALGNGRLISVAKN